MGGPEGDNPPQSCVLLTTPSNAPVDKSTVGMHEESYADPVFRAQVLGEHPAPWWWLRAQRAAAPPHLQSFGENKVQETLGPHPRL